jgi:hypothetical protein
MNGYWLPGSLRRRLGGQLPSRNSSNPSSRAAISHGSTVVMALADGRPAVAGNPRAICAEWPQLSGAEWQGVLTGLHENRQRLPPGPELWSRLQAALASAARRLADPGDPLHAEAIAGVPGYTGYSPAMIGIALASMGLMAGAGGPLAQLPRALALAPDGRVASEWQRMDGLPGMWRFYPSQRPARGIPGLPRRAAPSLFGPFSKLDMVLGYGAGNVPGTALLIAFLGLATTLVSNKTPAIIIRNSRQEPLFAPLVLAGIEAADAEIVSSIALLIWDYEDAGLQRALLSQADLVVAAAGDQTIAEIRRSLASARQRSLVWPAPGPAAKSAGTATRFHAHGHKVSFSAIGREMLQRAGQVAEAEDSEQQESLLTVVARLAALDSAIWDQNGCLSSRVHFVETGGPDCFTPEDYAKALAQEFGRLSETLPRGAWPRHPLHDRFDRYSLLQSAGQVEVISRYDDEFAVIVDRRRLDAGQNAAGVFHACVNDCQDRVVIVRPVSDLMEVPERYLCLISPENLQSLSVAVGRPGEGLTERFLAFATACGRRGVTAIRTVGRGAFPQLAYSWDGLVPLDFVRTRPGGHFTTIEFDAPYDQITATYREMAQIVSPYATTLL